MIRCDEWERGFNDYLPEFVKPEHEAAAMAALRERGLVEGDEPKLRFRAYPDGNTQLPHLDKDFFEPLVDICNELRKFTAMSGRQVSCTLENKFCQCDSAETPGANFKVDGYLKLDQTIMPVHQNDVEVANVAVPIECKRHRTQDSLRENRGQLLNTINFCMSGDPRRMHIYGITIEERTMTVWSFSRSHSARSPIFDFTRDPPRYIRIMLALLFATEKELGYDPTIKRHLDTTIPGVPRLCFIYAVGTIGEKVHFYKTLEAIFEHRSSCVTGRATRVWKVVEVGSLDDLQGFGPEMVLKDVWLDKGAKTEGGNQMAIFAQLEEIATQLMHNGKDSIENQNSTDILAFNSLDEKSKPLVQECLLNRSWNKYFLTVVHDWQGHTSKDSPPEHVVDNALFKSSPGPHTPATVPNPDLAQSNAFVTIDQSFSSANFNALPRRYLPKQQYRVVFKDLCEALHDIRRLRDVGTVLMDCVFGLQLMFVSGWVHRDISSGNLYARRVGTKVEGILADLEFAKRFEPERPVSKSDSKIGTAYFMAIEIHKQIPFAIKRSKPTLNNAVRVKHATGPTAPVPGVIYNFRHDLESIFWVLLWALLERVPLELPEDSGQHETFMKAAKAELSAIFRNDARPSIQRERLFVSSDALSFLMFSLFHPTLEGITGYLENFRAILAWNYGNRTSPQNLDMYSDIYPFAQTAARACIHADLDGDVPKLRTCRWTPDWTIDQPANKTPLPMHGKRKGGADGGERTSSDHASKIARMDAGSGDPKPLPDAGSGSPGDIRERDLSFSFTEPDNDNEDK
ncbi:hypothetical protein FRB90_012078 [Tulasnella sp. 427]|nr:hypothetical protein FRB90_012078 [Tulasnella sp. 427]